MSATPVQPALRLVRGDEPLTRRAVRATAAGVEMRADGAMTSPRARVQEQVTKENASAVSLSALDPRWVLAVQAYRSVQGGRAAVITPEERKRLMVVGNRLGLRAFDTSLVIAIVQDGARAGEDPLGSEAVGRLRLVGRESELSDAARGPSWGLVAALVMLAGVFGSAVTLAAMRMMH